MLCLLDYSGLYWRYWHATHDAGKAYELTVDQVSFYNEEYSRLVICCEGGDLERKKRFPDYKANRKPQPAEAMDAQRAALEQAESWWIPSVRVVGFEADDVIATLCAQSVDDVLIVSSDKDMYSLLSDSVTMETQRGRVGPDECMRKFGVRPDQMRDWLALVGDAADNVQGCPNCGPGRARDLLKCFDTIDGIRGAEAEQLTAVNGVGEKTTISLLAWDPTLALDMVTLCDTLEIDLDEIAPQESDESAE